MGNAISFRLNPKSENDRKILAWLEAKSSQPGYLNQTELIKQALLWAMESEQRGIREKETTENGILQYDGLSYKKVPSMRNIPYL